MRKPFETFKVENLTVKIYGDDAAPNPRTDFNQTSTMVCWHRKYCLGDEQPSCTPQEWLDSLVTGPHADLLERIETAFDNIPGYIKEYCGWFPIPSKAMTHRKLQEMHAKVREQYLNEHYFMAPLYLYDHSGLSISTGPFGCPWDSGRLGWAYIEKTSDSEEEKAKDIINAEVDEYNMFLSNDIWGFVIEDEEGEEVDSCWGLYGLKYAIEESKQAIKAIQGEPA